MHSHSHSDRLKKFAQLIYPIATTLKNEQVGKNAVTTEASYLTRAFDPPLSLDHSAQVVNNDIKNCGFFQSSGLDVDTEPMSLPDPLQSRLTHLSKQSVENKPFEHLRQHIMLRRSRDFENLTHREKALARVGGLLYTDRENYVQRSYHFLNHNVLIAVLDRSHHRFYMRREVPAVDFSDLTYVARPDIAGAACADFEAMPMQDAVWMYAQLDPEALLDIPSTLGVNWLQLRRLPVISPGLMTNHHMQTIRKILTHSQRFEQLRSKTPKHLQPILVNDLACLYLTRSLKIMDDDSQTFTRGFLTAKVVRR